MKPDTMLEACTPEALQKATREKEEQEAKIRAANKEREEHRKALDEAREKLAALAAKEEEVKALRLDRQEAIARGRDYSRVTSRIEACELELHGMGKEKSLLEDQEAAYLKAIAGCDAYLKALETDLDAHERELNRLKAGILANVYNDLGRRMAETVSELRHVCFAGKSDVFEGAPRPHGRYWGEGALGRIPMLRMDWDGVASEDAFFFRI